MIQANSLLLNFQMKSACYLVTLSLESSDFLTFLKQYVILVPFCALILLLLLVIFISVLFVYHYHSLCLTNSSFYFS